MNRLLILLMAFALFALPAAVAEPDDDALDLLDGEKDADPLPKATETLQGATGEIAEEPPVAADPTLLDGLLGGASDLLKGVGGALVDGVVGVVGAMGDVLLALWTGLSWAVTGLTQGTVAAFVWSATGVWTVMTGVVTGSIRLVTGLVTGAWTGLGHLALGAAGMRPDGMSQGAWAGTVAVAVTGASAAANFGLLEGLRRFGWLGAGLPLFSRIAKDDILEHPLRAEIFETIKTNPGIHISALARQVDAGWGTTIHHLRKLQEKELVAVRMVNNQKCFFQNGGEMGRSTWTQLPELKNETAARIAHYVLANPLSAVTSISDELGISPSLVSHHVRKLERAGVIEKHRDGRFVKLVVPDEARSSLFDREPASVPVADVGVAA